MSTNVICELLPTVSNQWTVKIKMHLLYIVEGQEAKCQEVESKHVLHA